MAAGSFTLTKQGDSYRILYSAKNFTSGLVDVKATPYNPSGSAQTQVTFSELGSSGVYYYDFDTTSKALGTWSFLVDSSAKSAPAYTRIQIVDGDTLDDTIWEKLDTMIDGLVSDMTTVKADVGTIKTDTGDIKGSGFTSSDSLHSMKAVVDAINTAVSGIQNNTSTTVALPESMLVPASGTTTYKVYVNIYDSEGHMEDPDSDQITVTVANQGGTDRSGNLGGLSGGYMTKVTTGRYSCTYAVASTHAIEELLFNFSYAEGGLSRNIDRASRTASSADDYTSRFNDIDTQLDTIEGKVDTVSGNVGDIETIVAHASHGNAALKTLIDAIQADIDDGTNGLAAIKTAVTGNYNLLTNGTYGLSALKAILDTITGYVDGVEVDLTAIKGSGWAAADNLKNISDYVKPGGIAL